MSVTLRCLVISTRCSSLYLYLVKNTPNRESKREEVYREKTDQKFWTNVTHLTPVNNWLIIIYEERGLLAPE